jgi:hypothetical protein
MIDLPIEDLEIIFILYCLYTFSYSFHNKGIIKIGFLSEIPAFILKNLNVSFFNF